MIEKIRDAKELLGIVGDAVHEAINELETAARQIDECATDLTEDFEQTANGMTTTSNTELERPAARRFKIGDCVRPKPEWQDDPNQIPTGIVRKIEIWGSDGALYVGDERRAFAAYVFERAQDY